VGFAAAAAGTVAEREGAAVSFGDLAAEREPDAGAAGLGSKEGNEEVGGIGNAGAIVLNHDLDRIGRGVPSHAHTAAGFQRGVGGILYQVDYGLLELVGIGVERYLVATHHLDGQTRFQGRGAADKRTDLDRL
jgi:hypothetical protein